MNKDLIFAVDEIPKTIHKRLHLIYFIVKMMFIGACVFMVIQYTALLMVRNEFNSINDSSGFVSHIYCGTFFVELNVENSFISESAAQEYIQGADKPFSEIIIVGMSIVILLCIFFALRNCDRKVIFSRKTSRLFLTSGILCVIVNLWGEYEKYTDMRLCKDLSIGILANERYYCQLYNVLAIPVMILCCGLLLRHHEQKLYNQSTKGNSIALKIIAISVLVISFSFIFYRFGIRMYELILVLSGENISVRLPFYSKLIELPYELAKTPDEYINLIIFRFLKDLPVFVASALVIILFSNVLFFISKGEINIAENRKKIRICIIALIVSSLLFNIFGLLEVNMLNSGFTGIYGGATYTIGLRSDCEPMLYAILLWFFLVFIQCVPQKNET